MHLASQDRTREMKQEIAKRIRLFRQQAGLSQERLAEQLGITPQQVQKYEAAVTRVPTDRLQQLARVLSVHIADFFIDNTGRPVLSENEAAFVNKLRKVRDDEVHRSLMLILERLAG